VEINAKTMTDFGPLPFDITSLHPSLPMQQIQEHVRQIQQTESSGSQFVCGSAVLERVSAVTEAMMRSEDKQLELFCFDNCKTHCTSSRLHLGSRLILAMRFPTNVTTFSEPFELLSKKPRKKGRKNASSSTSLTSVAGPPDSKPPDMTVLQIPTAMAPNPQLLAPQPPRQPAARPPTIKADSEKTKLPSPVKSSLMDIAAAAVVEEEIEAAKAAATTAAATAAAATAAQLASIQQQQQQMSPVSKKARLCNPV